MSDTSQCSRDDHVSNNSQRRAKRTIPDEQKDHKYWEKRKRNNMAAKRSREHKRSLENNIKHKVSDLEEENTLLRKEISLIKLRFGIPQDQSILTPEEREQCMLEIKLTPQAREGRRRKDSSTDDVTSTSPSVSERSFQQLVDEHSPEGKRERFDNGNSRTQISSSYGQSSYGPFIPSPSWAPGTSVRMSTFHDNDQVQNFSLNASHSKPCPSVNLDQAKSREPFNWYINRGMSGYTHPPYNYYMQYAGQAAHFYAGHHEEAFSDVGPADLSMNRSKTQDLERGSCGPNAIDFRNCADESGSSHIAQTITSSANQTLCLTQTATKNIPSSSGQSMQDQFCRGPNLLESSQGQHSAAAHTDHSSNFTYPEQENLRRENEALKLSLQTLAAQVELIKDQANQH